MGGSGVSVGTGVGVFVGVAVGSAVSKGMGVGVSVGIEVGLGVGVKVGRDRSPEATAREIGCGALALLSKNQIASPEPNTTKVPTIHNAITTNTIIKIVGSLKRIVSIISQKFYQARLYNKQLFTTNRLSTK